MKRENGKVAKAIFSLVLLVVSLFANVATFAVVAPVALAANGLGEITQFQTDSDYIVTPPQVAVMTVNAEKDVTLWLHNNDPVGGHCIDEIIVTFPSTWQGNVDVANSEVTNMGTVVKTSEKDDGSYSGLTPNTLSLRVVPDYTQDGVELCPSGTSKITIKGLKAPANAQDSTIMIMTSDEDSNEPSSSQVRYPISVLPHILVTRAEKAVIKYLDFLSTSTGSSPAEYTINAQAKGGWGRLNDLYVNASAGMTVDVYVENSGAGLQTGTDFKIASGKVLAAGVNTISMSYLGVEDAVGQMTDGFLKDAEQGGVARNYYIDIVAGSGTLQFLGHTDEDAAENIDPTYSGTSYTNPPKEGTVINVENVMKRKLLVQLVRDDAGRELDVPQSGIPIYFTTSMSTFVAGDVSPRLTDASGQVEIRLNPGTVAGNAFVSVCFPDPTCTDEDVAISPGAPVSCQITKGLDTTVEAGSVETIEATLYDQYGNVISNSPSAPLVTFDILSAPGTDADLDDDTNPPFVGDGDGFEQEVSQFGIADVSLQTSATVGDNVVEVKAGNLNCGITTVKGVLGQGDRVDCEALNVVSSQVTADQCVDVLVHVLDKNGNALPKWESVVEISLDELDMAGNGQSKYIQSTNLREQVFVSPTIVKGKLNNNNPAYATVTVCGCEGLGTFNVTCKSDTLKKDTFALDVVNSKPTCIDVAGFDRKDSCDPSVKLETSILDTCENKVVDQECSEGGWASSCVRLQTTCGTLSTDKTCVDLRNTGVAPLVDLDLSGCACPGVTVTAVDEADCCRSVYDGALPMCEPNGLELPIIGPADHIDMSVFPEAQNQEKFWVSERTVADLTLKDSCDQVATCSNEKVDVKLSGEDCVDTTIQVDSPYTASEPQPVGTPDEQGCSFENVPVHKVVVENCADASKLSGEKEWTDLPENKDLEIDKIAFSYDGPSTNVMACIYEETEETAGFQPSQDKSWGCMQLDSVPTVPTGDSNSNYKGAWDQIHDLDGARNGTGDVYLLELKDRVSKYDLNEYDNQRMGGAIVQPGDTKDFYVVLSSVGPVECGTYDADYLYYEDYNSPDIIEWSPENKYNTHVLDTLEGSEKYTKRNDDYKYPDPYPVHSRTKDYGFGDTELHALTFDMGHAYVVFRDLVTETVQVFVDSHLPVQLVTMGYPVTADNQAKITFLHQPATQVVARNHGDLSGDSYVCDDVSYESTIQSEMGEDDQCVKGLETQLVDGCSESFVKECRPAMACSDEGYDINLQVADGFQNQVPLSTEVQLHQCLTFPHFIYLGDSFLPVDENVTVDLWDFMGLNEPTSDPWDACFDMGKFRLALKQIVAMHTGHEDYFASAFLDSQEFGDFVKRIFEDVTVDFEAVNGYPLSNDSAGNLIVTTDSSGKAKVRVTSDDSSMFLIKSFDASYRLFFVPHALDADYLDVAFAPGEPAKWDVIAWPQKGIPADGEQEASLLIRKTDACNNPVAVDEPVKVSVSGSAIISRDFSGNNNYDNEVTGDMSQWTCKYLFPWFGDCSLQVMDDVIENVVVKVEDAQCEGTENGFCTGLEGLGCETFQTEEVCNAHTEGCEWVPEQICQQSDSTVVRFVGAPTKLVITSIIHSDLIPADGWLMGGDTQLPVDACTVDQLRECELFGNQDICFKHCVQYGNSGAWVNVEVQDKYGNHVSSYLGDGFKGDPGDKYGKADYVAEKVCVALDDPRAFIQDYTFGWVNLHQVAPYVYCGDLAYGAGSFKVSYGAIPPLDAEETRKVIVSVFDACDTGMMEQFRVDKSKWDDLCNGQEYNENNLPDSETASRLNADSGKLIFVGVPDRWDVHADKLVVAADGEDFATLEINTENEYMDVRAALDATVQSSLLGSKLESDAITPGCYVKGTYDPLNPTSINVMTEACSGGRAKLKLTSTEPGIARITVTGNGLGCVHMMPLAADSFVPYCMGWGVVALTPKTIEVEFKQSFAGKIDLKEGWNFFSVPTELDPSNDQWSELGLNTKCSASAMWDDATQTWVAPVPASTKLMPLEGYWCKVAAAESVPVTALDTSGGVYLPPTKHIYAGWNDMGLSTYVETKMEHALISIDKIYAQVLDWAESLQRYFAVANTGELGGGNVPGTTGTNNMYAGQGYFVYATEAGNVAGLQ
jgi:hypothetical protein